MTDSSLNSERFDFVIDPCSICSSAYRFCVSVSVSLKHTHALNRNHNAQDPEAGGDGYAAKEWASKEDGDQAPDLSGAVSPPR